MIADLTSSYLIDLVVDRAAYVWLPSDAYSSEEFALRFWDSTAYQFMVKDQRRMDTYRRVISRSVKDKVVLEVGTGALAPLSRMCVEAGAAKVYAIEANPKAAEMARRGLARDGLADKVEVIQGFSYDVTLPERAEVLVHEVVGNMGKDEGMARIVHDAKRRLLRDDALILPEHCAVRVAPVGHEVQGNPLPIHLFRALYWTLRTTGRKSWIWNFPEADVLAPDQEYEHIRFAEDFDLIDRRELAFTLDAPCAFTGFLFWNVITVGGDDVIDCRRGTHWPSIYLPVCREALALEAGDRIVLRTWQDMRVTPTYRFEARVERAGEVIALPPIAY